MNSTSIKTSGRNKLFGDINPVLPRVLTTKVISYLTHSDMTTFRSTSSIAVKAFNKLLNEKTANSIFQRAVKTAIPEALEKLKLSDAFLRIPHEAFWHDPLKLSHLQC